MLSTYAVKSRSSSNPTVQVGTVTGKLGFPSSGHAHITRVQLPRMVLSAQEINRETRTQQRTSKLKLNG